MGKSKVKRTRDGRLRLFDRAVTALRAESGGNFSWTVTDEGKPVRPPRADFRSFLMAVRPFDAPKEDVYLPTILADVRSFAIEGETKHWIDIQEAIYLGARDRVFGTITLNGEVISGRMCFEQLAYTEHLHYDAENEARQQAADPLAWEFVLMSGALYAGVVANAAIVLRSLARDDPASGHLFAPRESGKETAVEWLVAHSSEGGVSPT
jgi:hypothetical protein